MANLQSAYQVHLAYLGSPEAASGQLFGGLGYSGRFAAGWEEAVSIFMADEARYLADADLYVLTPQMCDTVIAAALTLTVDDLTLIDAGDLPSRGGLVVLPHPVIVRAVTGDLGDDRAFGWRSPMQLQAVADDGRRQELPAVRMSTYHDTSGLSGRTCTSGSPRRPARRARRCRRCRTARPGAGRCASRSRKTRSGASRSPAWYADFSLGPCWAHTAPKDLTRPLGLPHVL